MDDMSYTTGPLESEIVQFHLERRLFRAWNACESLYGQINKRKQRE